MFTVWKRCDVCHKWRGCESVTGMCESCWDKISDQNARTPVGPLLTANIIVMPQAVLSDVARALAMPARRASGKNTK